MTRVLRASVIASALAIAAFGGGCSGGTDDAGGGGEGGSSGAAHLAPAAAPDSLKSLDDSGRSSGGTTTSYSLGESLPDVGPRVIKTADVSLEIDRGALQDSIRQVVEVARTNGGFVLSTSIRDESGHRGTVVLRVPAERFESALAGAEAIGDVTSERVAGGDVSQEFVDLEARLRNFEAQESVLLKLMARSTSVADTLRVQRELQDVQLEIERLRGRLRYLRDQTDLSTITLDLDEAGATVAGTSTIGRAWQKAVDTFTAVVSGVVIGLGVVIPLALFALLAFLIGRLVLPRLPSWGSRNV